VRTNLSWKTCRALFLVGAALLLYMQPPAEAGAEACSVCEDRDPGGHFCGDGGGGWIGMTGCYNNQDGTVCVLFGQACWIPD
jgi:hypothetical protein